MKRLLNNKYLLTIILSLIIASSIIIPKIIQGNGILTIFADFNYQQIPFGINLNDLIKEGSFNWNWKNDIGTGFIGSFSFYNLGSIFFWITLVFPSNIYPYLIGPMMIIKYIIASLIAFIFLKRYVKNKDYAIIGALLYSFSGFQITNMLFNHFHDVVALFPLILIGMDKLVLDNKRGIFAIAIAMSAITNYFFFIGQVVFAIIYFFIKIITKQYKINVQKFKELVIEAVLGFGISMIIFIPSILFILTNPRVETAWGIKSALKPNLITILEIARAILMPPETMSMRSLFTQTNFSSIECYLPFVGTFLYLTYIWKKPKDWISILIIVCFICMVIPILNSLFFALTTTYYARWIYMLILMLALASIKTLDEKIPIKSGIILTLFGYLVFTFLVMIYSNRGNTIILNEKFVIQNLLISILGILGIVITFNYKEKTSIFISLLILGISIISIYVGNVFFNKYNKVVNIEDFYIYKFEKEDYKKLDFIKDGERTDGSINAEYNIGYIYNIPYLKNWNSTINGNIICFYNSIGIPRNVDTAIQQDNKVRDFLSVRYIFTKKDEENNNMILVESIGEYNIYENPNFVSMGIPYKYYILNSDYENLDNKTKRDLLMHSVVLEESQVQKYSNIMEKININEISEYNSQYNEYIEELKTKTSYDFRYTKSGCNFKIDAETDKFIVLSIPYDKGWTVKANGKEIEYEKINYGLMGFKIEKGTNNIELEYNERGLKIGLIISVISIVALIMYLSVYKKTKK